MEEINKPLQKPVNGAGQIAEVMSQILRPAVSGDHEMLKLVAEYSIQLTPQQQWALTMLSLFANDEKFTENVRQEFKTFRDSFIQWKRYHDSAPYVLRAVDSFTGYRLWNTGAIQGKLNKMQ